MHSKNQVRALKQVNQTIQEHFKPVCYQEEQEQQC